MDFELDEDVRAFADEVEAFLDEHDDPDVFDVTRENMAQIVDTPQRRAFLKRLAEKGWLGLTWPREWGGQERPGVYEYVLNEALARRGGPQIGKGVGIIGKTLLAHGSERLKREFLPRILAAEIEFAVGYSEPGAGSDAASMRLRAVRDGDGWRLSGQKVWTTSAHFADWYWLGARTDPDSKHHGITLFLVPMDHPGITVKPIWTMGGAPMGAERTNEVYVDDVWVSDDYVVGEVNRGFQYIAQALDLERFSMFTFGPIEERLSTLLGYVRTAQVDGLPLSASETTRRRLARLATEGEVARLLGLRVLDASMRSEVDGGPPPTTEASEYKLYATEFSQRLADASMDLGAPGTQLRVKTDSAPMAGRAESTYRYTVIDTIGGGTSQVQRNIIDRRRLGLPRNF